MVFYGLVPWALVLFVARGAEGPPDHNTDDYQEECLSEGCDTEEKDELYESYKEECLNEGCSDEETTELAGNPGAVNEMLGEFQRLGWKVDPKHLCDFECQQTLTCELTSCKVFVQTCCNNGNTRGWCFGWWGCPPENTGSTSDPLRVNDSRWIDSVRRIWIRDSVRFMQIAQPRDSTGQAPVRDSIVHHDSATHRDSAKQSPVRDSAAQAR